jgi:hypothetical protein
MELQNSWNLYKQCLCPKYLKPDYRKAKRQPSCLVPLWPESRKHWLAMLPSVPS